MVEESDHSPSGVTTVLSFLVVSNGFGAPQGKKNFSTLEFELADDGYRGVLASFVIWSGVERDNRNVFEQQASPSL
ncbi:hypothetical protein pipiens_011615 [Culex pipiens pipiens]|uniref:Uncharacterized protein n=1 Tax=Culex pipiens pipiens TaxID=38569 RepID=A0ABD1D631_CULPP